MNVFISFFFKFFTIVEDAREIFVQIWVLNPVFGNCTDNLAQSTKRQCAAYDKTDCAIRLIVKTREQFQERVFQLLKRHGHFAKRICAILMRCNFHRKRIAEEQRKASGAKLISCSARKRKSARHAIMTQAVGWRLQSPSHTSLPVN